MYNGLGTALVRLYDETNEFIIKNYAKFTARSSKGGIHA